VQELPNASWLLACELTLYLFKLPQRLRILPAFIKFVREHHCPSFLEYGEYPYVSAEEIKNALKLKAAFSNMLDQMQ
jgi:hypothetical protein